MRGRALLGGFAFLVVGLFLWQKHREIGSPSVAGGPEVVLRDVPVSLDSLVGSSVGAATVFPSS